MIRKPQGMLFKGEMVRAILAGTKTVTRRTVALPDWAVPNWSGVDLWPNQALHALSMETGSLRELKPRWRAGDLLWVKETYVIENTRDYHGDHDVPRDGRPVKTLQSSDYGAAMLIPRYRATEPEPHIVPYKTMARESYQDDDDRTRWSSSMFMPAWASRITLKVHAVTAERLHNIDESDARREGVESRHAYQELWDTINAGHAKPNRPGTAWGDNPWVWVIRFEAVTRNVSEVVADAGLAGSGSQLPGQDFQNHVSSG